MPDEEDMPMYVLLTWDTEIEGWKTDSNAELGDVVDALTDVLSSLAKGDIEWENQ